MNIEQLTHHLGIDLNEMQKATVDAIQHGHGDLVLLSPTGTGKTYAYLLPLIEQLDAESEELQALVVVPGRELALQSAHVLQDTKSGLRTFACYGGRAAMDEHRKLRDVQPQIVFGTPGRLIDHLDKGNLSAKNVKWLIIDEFDKCLDMGFADQLSKLLESLPNVKRRILLSATDVEQIPSFVDLKNAKRLDFLPEEEKKVEERVVVFSLRSQDKDKLGTLSELLRFLGQQSSIVFLNYRESVERVSQYLHGEGFELCSYHGGLDQKSRENALLRFSQGSANVLVSTDLGSRGLDIPSVENIIHYHLPETEEAYIHRVGRTARWNQKGRTIFLLGPEEQIPQYVTAEVDNLTLPESLPATPVPMMATLYIGKGKKDKISKGDIVGFLCKKGGLRGDEIGQIDLREHYVYVAVKRTKLSMLLQKVSGEKLKGLHTIVEEIK
jgi:ATP-independent RNA helicase DbpA